MTKDDFQVMRDLADREHAGRLEAVERHRRAVGDRVVLEQRCRELLAFIDNLCDGCEPAPGCSLCELIRATQGVREIVAERSFGRPWSPAEAIGAERDQLARAWDEGFMNAAGQDHPAYPRTRRIDNPYEVSTRPGKSAGA